MKTLTAIMIFSIIWFVAVVAWGLHFEHALINPASDIPTLYVEGILSFSLCILVVKFIRSYQ
jgi:hypothetical protein